MISRFYLDEKSTRKLVRTLGAVVIAICCTAGVYSLDRASSRSSQKENSLPLLRQIAAQSEGLFFYARQKSENDPIGWTINYLSQGTEPRVMHLLRVHTSPGQLPEIFEFQSEKHLFEYTRILIPENGDGIKIQLEAPYIGFLGTKTRFVNDLLALLCFGFFLGTVFQISNRIWSRTATEEIPVPILKSIVVDWIRESKTLLSGLGISVRDLIKEARNIVIAATQSRKITAQLKKDLAREFEEVKTSRVSLIDFDRHAVQSESITLNLVIEASRLGDEGKKLGKMCEELHSLIKKMRAQNLLSEASVARIADHFEPLIAEAEQAFHSYEEVFKATKGMDAYIQSTSAGLLDQAKQFGKLRKQMESESDSENLAA